jgi:hypothetical protein
MRSAYGTGGRDGHFARIGALPQALRPRARGGQGEDVRAREGTRKKTCGLREARAHWPTLCDAREVEEGLEAGGGDESRIVLEARPAKMRKVPTPSPPPTRTPPTLHPRLKEPLNPPPFMRGQVISAAPNTNGTKSLGRNLA